MPKWRLLLDAEPRPGAWNMALDDFLFRSLGDRPGTVLRFYAWERPTVSLGYSQKIARVLDVDFCRKEGIDIVRRITGGKLVLHDREVTYSICSSDTDTFGATLPESYRRIAEALMRGLGGMGIDPCLADAPPVEYVRGNLPCFSYPAKNEIEVKGLKIVGSAQKRVGGRFLQHGSIPLAEDDVRLRRVSLLDRKGGEEVRMISLSKALGRPVSFTEAAAALAEGFAAHFRVRLEPEPLTPEESSAVEAVLRDRHAQPAWIRGEHGER